MRPSLIIFSAIALVLLATLATRLLAARAPEITLGKGSLGAVSFPEAWTAIDAQGNRVVVGQPAEYVFREAAPETLLVGLQGPSLRAEAHYAVEQGFGVHPIPPDEWSRSREVPCSRRPVPLGAGGDTGVRFKERSFAASGKSLGAALPSPDEKWLALLSVTARGAGARPFFSFIGGSGPEKGELFVDVFEVASGEKRLAGRAAFSRGLFLGAACWAGARWLVVPFDSLMQKSFVARLPAQ